MTLYEILEVSEKASSEVIEKAYKTLAKKYHPDLQQTPEDKKTAEAKMQKINEAYETLKDEAKRSEYDRKLQIERDKQAESYQYNNRQQNISYQNIRQQMNENLSPKEREKLMKRIQRDAKEEYTRVAEDYFRQQGYRVKHRTTASEYLEIALTIFIIICIFVLLWVIPPSRNWMISLYNENVALKILVDAILGLVKAVFDLFKKSSF